MEESKNKIVPFKAIHPGRALGDELDARGISVREFAKMINVKPTTIKAYIKGKCNITTHLR